VSPADQPADGDALLSALRLRGLDDVIRSMIDEDEDEISDFIAEDYSDEGDPVSGGEILEWRVTDARRVERAFQVGCEVDVGYERDGDDSPEFAGGLAGTCWFILQLTESEDGLDCDRSWVTPYRESQISWPDT